MKYFVVIIFVELFQLFPGIQSDQNILKAQNNRIEKFSIVTDRDVYFPNENIWFNIRSIDYTTNQPVLRSHVIYLELVDMKGTPKVQMTFSMLKENVNSKLTLPYNLTSGIYYLRVYSNYLKNFSESAFGVKIIQVINPDYPPGKEFQDDKEQLELYYEGGSLIQDEKSRVLAFLKSKNGIFSDSEFLYLSDDRDSVIMEIPCTVPGVFLTELTPEYQKTLYFQTRDKSVRRQLNILPFGYYLNLQETTTGFDLITNGRAEHQEKLILKCFFHSVLLFEKHLSSKNLPEFIHFENTDLPEGLIRFELSDLSGSILSQRMVFNEPLDQVDIKISLETEELKRKDSASLTLLVPQELQNSSLSVSIRKKVLSLPRYELSAVYNTYIRPYLNDWDLFRQIELRNPEFEMDNFINFYLISAVKDSIHKSINQTESIRYMPESEVKIISGIAQNPVNNLPVSNERLFMYYSGSIPYMLQTVTNEAGKFKFYQPLMDFGKNEVIVEPENYKQELKIRFEWPYYESYSPYQLNYYFFDSTRLDQYDFAYFNWQINSGYFQKQQELLKRDEVYEKLSFYGTADHRFYPDQYIRMNDMAELIKEIIDGVKLTERDNIPALEIYDINTNNVLGENPLILFNSYKITNLKSILSVPVGIISFVDVVQETFYIGDNRYDGVINFVPKDAWFRIDIPENSDREALELFSKRFYFNLDNKSSIPFLRNSLYWNPDLKTVNEKNTIDFFTGYQKGEYEIVVEGIDRYGKPIHTSKLFYIN